MSGLLLKRHKKGKDMDYNGKYLKIRKAVHEAGFDDFSQAGTVSRFHKMNIVADSASLGKRFWFCISGGYNVRDEFYIVTRDLASGKEDERVYCKNQAEMADKIRDIGNQISVAKVRKDEK